MLFGIIQERTRNAPGRIRHRRAKKGTMLSMRQYFLDPSSEQFRFAFYEHELELSVFRP